MLSPFTARAIHSLALRAVPEQAEAAPAEIRRTMSMPLTPGARPLPAGADHGSPPASPVMGAAAGPLESKDPLDLMATSERRAVVQQLEWEVRLWASYRSQTVARTLRGAITYARALELRARLAEDDAKVVSEDPMASESWRTPHLRPPGVTGALRANTAGASAAAAAAAGLPPPPMPQQQQSAAAAASAEARRLVFQAVETVLAAQTHGQIQDPKANPDGYQRWVQRRRDLEDLLASPQFRDVPIMVAARGG